MTEDEQEAVDLAAALTGALLDQSNDVPNRLIDSLTYQRDYLSAQIDLMREKVDDLLSRRFAPNPMCFKDAMWPGEMAIQQRLKDMQEVSW